MAKKSNNKAATAAANNTKPAAVPAAPAAEAAALTDAEAKAKADAEAREKAEAEAKEKAEAEAKEKAEAEVPDPELERLKVPGEPPKEDWYRDANKAELPSELLERYTAAYPWIDAFFVSSDNQVFLPDNKQLCREHQAGIDRDAKALRVLLK